MLTPATYAGYSLKILSIEEQNKATFTSLRDDTRVSGGQTLGY
jgi:hypothetical protein